MAREDHSNSKDGSQGHSNSEDGFEDHSDSEKRLGSKDMEVDEAVAKGSSKKRKVRRAAKCVKIKKLKKGEYQGVVYNESGQPIGQGGTDIGSYGGYLVRARVRITITNWKDVSPTLKKNLWISLKEKFKLDTNERSIRTSRDGRGCGKHSSLVLLDGTSYLLRINRRDSRKYQSCIEK
ncbi:hypothetical protein IFM89_022065 [Coptis chinensis]|uniref:Uncharacterized protein n=1 Tax=Coptis chinensis TaxID=261450 RepID=A0A835LN43_9MAGN|nr:hypothetical protein IFM89_022065 [Coptis chinensis]